MIPKIIQETLKVSIIAYTIIVMTGMLFIFIESFSRSTSATIFDTILLVIAFFAGIISVIFHIKTYPYYSKITRKRNIPKAFLAAALIFPSYVVYFIGVTFKNFFYATDASITQDITGFVLLMVILLFSLLSIIEVLLMVKRVQKQDANLHLKSELDTVGKNLD